MITDKQAFEDFWQEMGERGGVFDVFSDVGIDLEDALKGITTPEDIQTHYYWHIPPLEINQESQQKIIEHYGGIKGIHDFMAYNAGWEKYQKLLEGDLLQ